MRAPRYTFNMAARKPITKAKRKSARKKPMEITPERGGPPVLSPLEKGTVSVETWRKVWDAIAREREKAGKAP